MCQSGYGKRKSFVLMFGQDKWPIWLSLRLKPQQTEHCEHGSWLQSTKIWIQALTRGGSQPSTSSSSRLHIVLFLLGWHSRKHIAWDINFCYDQTPFLLLTNWFHLRTKNSCLLGSSMLNLMDPIHALPNKV